MAVMVSLSSKAGSADSTLLFSPSPTSRGLDARSGPSQGNPIELNSAAFEPGAVQPGNTLLMEPLPGTFFTVIVEKIVTDVNGTLSWKGQVQGYPNAFFLLSYSDGQALGSIEFPDEGKRYFIRYDAALQQHVAQDALPAEWKELEDSPSLIPPALNLQSLVTQSPPTPTGPTTIDVMIVYTPNAKTWANTSGGGINNVIAQAMSRGQQTMDNTAVPVTLRLIHSAEVSYTESGNSNTDLNRLTNPSDGYMDNVHTLRSTYGADLVALFTQIEDTGGLGWLLDLTTGRPTHAFSISRVQQVASGYTTIHELGHNMGCHHRRNQSTQPGPGLYSYSAGWHWTGVNNGKYASVMSYEDGGYSRVAYWSSPTNKYMGVATGSVNDDNARTIQNIKNVIAAYKSAPAAAFTFRAVALTNNVILRWTNPTNCGITSPYVYIVTHASRYPTNTSDGTPIYYGTNQVYEHTGLPSNQTNYYTIWVSNDGFNFVDPP
ncbi:MAG: hypothetical protein A2X46_15890 [Lentisphaerae bacterium GWF2_57_35]|nr:MAG: hypothetical protein A2X46_15890 [Lentisphaerae bacterium GWF2_57_35]